MDRSDDTRSAGAGVPTRAASVVAALSGIAAGFFALQMITPVFGVLLKANDPWAYIYGFFLTILLVLSPLGLVTGGLVGLRRPSRGGGVAFGSAIGWLWVLALTNALSPMTLAPAAVGFVAGLVALAIGDRAQSRQDQQLVHRQRLVTRITHWTWAVCLFFLLLTGLQIFNAHPALYIGPQSGFAFDNAILRLEPERVNGSYRGITTILGAKFDTTGVLGMSGTAARPDYQGFPKWATIPSFRDLATGRVIHFFFGWIFIATMLVWFVFSFFNGHLRRDVLIRPRDLKDLPRDIADHATFRFHHTRSYSPLQKLAYSVVFFILFPLIILTGLGMSPGMDSAWPWLIDIWGGRQTVRTIHFLTMVALVLFFIVHIVMVVLAGPFNELRSMISGWYRTSTVETGETK